MLFAMLARQEVGSCRTRGECWVIHGVQMMKNAIKEINPGLKNQGRHHWSPNWFPVAQKKDLCPQNMPLFSKKDNSSVAGFVLWMMEWHNV